jgi:hypothetical protein
MNSDHFLQLLKSVNLQAIDTLASYDAVSLFTNVPVDEALQVMRNKFHKDATLAERSLLQVEAIMELLEFYLRTIFSGGQVLPVKRWHGYGELLSLIVSNIFMEHF